MNRFAVVVVVVPVFAAPVAAQAQTYPAKRLRAIAVSSAKPSAALPGVGAPPKELIAWLNQEIARGYSAPDVRERLQREGNDVVLNTAEQFDAFFRGEMDKWAKVIKAAGIVIQ